MRDHVESETPELEYPYFKFPELFPAKPLTQILRIEVATGTAEVVHEDHCFITHVNMSPTRPELLTFCHEGPWNLVDQRIWGLNIETGEAWKIRDQSGENITIGHEYWFTDGEHIGFHGRNQDTGLHTFGHIRWDNSDHVEVNFPFHSFHFASHDEHLLVGDGTRAYSDPAQPFIQLFRWDGEQYIGPKVLAVHRSTFNHQHSHCHPRFTPDGQQVLYVTDATGYANMYLVPVGDFEALPDLADVIAR
jgi:oligogalacturonide lyase